MNENTKKLEAILFSEGAPVSRRYLISALAVPNVDEYIKELMEARSDSGVLVADDGKNVSLITNKDMAEYIKELKDKDIAAPLSKATQETLAIIAYAGPISKVDVDYLRGVNTAYSIRKLLTRGLVREEKDGRGKNLNITIDFLLYNGIEKVENLMDYETIHPKMIESLEAIKKRMYDK